MKSILTKVLASLALISVLAASASALSIYDVSGNHTATVFPGLNNGNGYSYDYDVDTGNEAGALASLLTTTMINSVTAQVTWSPIGSLEFDTIYLKAGGGGSSGGGYLVWDVSGVNWSIYDGFSITNDIFLNKNQKALCISHFNAVGAEVPVPGVPDSGTTAILLGLGLLAIGLIRRKAV
jgi:hypothetical protein